MQNSEALVPLGIAVIVISALAIVVPYLRGRSDMLTAWNFVLFGGMLFVGVGSLGVVYGDFHWPELKWFQPTRTDVNKYVLGVTVFYSTLLVTHFFFSWPKKLCARFLNKWPPVSLPLILGSLLLFGALAIFAEVARGTFFFGTLSINISHKALVFAVVFSFCFWYQNKKQLLLLLLFLGVFLLAALDAMVLFRGRRLLLSVAVAPLICMYWLHWRTLPPARNLIRLAAATAIAVTVAAVYNSFRHYESKGETERGYAATIAAMKTIDIGATFKDLKNNSLLFFGQYCGQYSLLTIHLVENKQVPVKPLHSLAFLATYPIPRDAYPNKPQLLGLVMVRDVLRLPYQTNWGLGIVGIGYQEGGLLTIMLYAVLIVLGCRLIDDALVRQPANLFLLGILSTAAPHFATLIRGDPAVMTAEIAESFFFAWGLGLMARFLFGTATTPQQPGPAFPTSPRFGHPLRQTGR